MLTISPWLRSYCVKYCLNFSQSVSQSVSQSLSHKITPLFVTGEEESFEDNVAPLLYPNPVTDRLNIRYIPLKNTELNISIYNVLGEMVYNGSQTFTTNSTEFAVDMSNYATGTYAIRLSDGNKAQIIRVTKMK